MTGSMCGITRRVFYERRLSLKRQRLCILWASIGLLAVAIRADVISGDPQNYHAGLRNLSPGDTLLLAPGDYMDGLPIEGLNGEPGRPIVIQGPVDGPAAVFWARACCNTINIKNAGYVEIRNLELNRRGLPAGDVVDAIKAEGDSRYAHHFTLENLRIFNYGNDQQAVGISTKCPAWDWVIRKNVIWGAGTGLYLGDSEGDQPFVNGLIEYNLIVDTLGYNMQIKHQRSRPRLEGMPRDGVTIIRHNVLSKAANGTVGENARPNLLVGHWPLTGDGSGDRYEIYGNFFYQNPTDDVLLQGEGNLAVYNNLFVNRSGSAVSIRPHNDRPRMVYVFNNTVVARDGGITVSGGAPGYTQRVVANAVFASLPIRADDAPENIIASYALASTYLMDPEAPPGEMNLYPKEGMLSGALIEPGLLHTGLTAWNLDFNGDPHFPIPGIFRGAYAGEERYDAWRPSLEIKPSP